jgi:hypothetical protein
MANDGRYPTLELDPQQRRQKTLEALTAQLHRAFGVKVSTSKYSQCP